MADFNSVPPASDNVYRNTDETVEETSGSESSNVSKKQDNSGMKRAGDSGKGSSKSAGDMETSEDGNEVVDGAVSGGTAAAVSGGGSGAGGAGSKTLSEKLSASAKKKAGKAAGKAAAGAAAGTVLGAVGSTIGSAVQAAAAIIAQLPSAIIAVIIAVIVAIVTSIIAAIMAIIPSTDAVPSEDIAFAYRSAIATGWSADASLVENMQHDVARRIWTAFSGMEVMDYPTDWEGAITHVTDTSSYGSDSDVQKKITYGMRPAQIFAILGNWTAESGLDPTAVETITDEPFMIGIDKQWAMSNDWVVDLWDSIYPETKAYFESHPTIHRNGIGLAQWTDVLDPGAEFDVHNPGRNAKLMQYAKLFAMEYYLDTSHTGWNGEDWVKGNTTIEPMWYDVRVQLAYAMDKSSVGDTLASWLWDWSDRGKDLFDADEAAKVAEASFNNDEKRGWDVGGLGWNQGDTTNPDGVGDGLTSTPDGGAGTGATGAYKIVANKVSLANEGDGYDAIGDGTLHPGTFYGGEVEIDRTNTPETDDYYKTIDINNGNTMHIHSDTSDIPESDGVYYWFEGNVFHAEYKRVRCTYTYTDSIGTEHWALDPTPLEFEGEQAARDVAKARAIDEANYMWERFLLRYNPNRDVDSTEGGQRDPNSYRDAPDKHILCVYGQSCTMTEGQITCGKSEHTHSGSCYSVTCGQSEHTHGASCYTSGALTCGQSEHTHTSSCESLTCGQEAHTHTDACKHHHGHVGTEVTISGVPGTFYTASGDCFTNAQYFIVEDNTASTAVLHEYSVDANDMAKIDWIECFKYYYRKYLYEAMTAYYTGQFLCEYEGIASGNYDARFQYAMKWYDMWWDTGDMYSQSEGNSYYKTAHYGNDVAKTKSYNPGNFEDYFFHCEQPYAKGIQDAIEHTADELNQSQQRAGKIWNADKVMADGERVDRYSVKDAAMAACIIAWPTIADSRDNNGTAVYQYIHDQVIQGDTIYMSCDRSVCTAVRWSGIDDNFPAGDTTVQLEYLTSSPNWVELDWNGDINNLQPGDVLIRKSHLFKTGDDMEGDTAHHIVMFIGYWMADMNGMNGLTEAERTASSDVADGSCIMHGSYGERSPGIGQFYDDLGRYHAFRCIYPMEEGTSKYVRYKYSG